MSFFNRTFHPDEANQAFTTGRLIETGAYRYDPSDHHGPTLYYAAAAIQKVAGNNSTAMLDGSLLRCTPLLFAVLALLFSFLALAKILKKVSGVLWVAAAFTALLASSPIFLFFATDFIQEMMLACFSAMMFWAAAGYAIISPGKNRIKSGTWALFFGIAAGLAFSTKETSLLTFGAMFAPFLATVLYCRKNNIPCDPADRNKIPSHLVLAVAGFFLTAILFYSSFAQNFQGVYNAFVTAPLSYLYRAAGHKASQGATYHIHPWWQYFRWLFGCNTVFAVFSAAGMALGFFSLQKDLTRNKIPVRLKAALVASLGFVLSLSAIYSGIPYKTPWCALQLHIPILAAAFLGLWAFGTLKSAGKILFYVLSMLLLCENAIVVAKMWRNPDSKDIAYNYASASPQVKEMAKQIEEAISAKKDRPQAFVAVALKPEDTWPLPFYLRKLEARVGYWTRFEDLEVIEALGRKPDVVVVPAEHGHLVQPLFPYLNKTKRFEMRHRVRVRVFWQQPDDHRLNN